MNWLDFSTVAFTVSEKTILQKLPIVIKSRIGALNKTVKIFAIDIKRREYMLIYVLNFRLSLLKATEVVQRVY